MRVGLFSAGRLVARLLIAAATLLFITLVAHADSMSTYSVSGSNGFRSSLSGIVTIDTSTNVIEGVDLVAGGEDLTAVENQFYGNGSYSGLLGPQTATFSLADNVLFLVAGTGTYQGAVTLETSTTSTSSSSSTSSSAKSAVTTAATPEPCSFLLLLTGLGGIAALARKNAKAGRGDVPANDSTAALLVPAPF